MSPLVPAPTASSKLASVLPGGSPDRTSSSSKLTGSHVGHPLQHIRPNSVNTVIPLPYLPIPFIVVPLLAVFGQRVLSPLCWPAPFVSICATHSPTGYFLTYLATALGLFILSPFWHIHITYVQGTAWYATKLAAGPVGSLLLQWLMGNDHNPRLLGLFWIFLAMSVGQGTAWALSSFSQVLLEDVQWLWGETRGYEDGVMHVGGHEELSDDDW